MLSEFKKLNYNIDVSKCTPNIQSLIKVKTSREKNLIVMMMKKKKMLKKMTMMTMNKYYL